MRRRRNRVLYFSRGRGSGHAIPDVAIIEAARQVYPDFDVRFVSYDRGAEALDRLGYAVIDLKLPANPPFLEAVVREGRVIHQFQPDLIISHEEFAALPMAKQFGLPTLFITHWFWKPTDLLMHCLNYADLVLFIEEPGLFEELPWVKDRVRYFGPIVRDLGYTLAERERVRTQSGFLPTTKLISVMPGSWREEQTPLAGRLIPAFRDLPFEDKRLIWIAGGDTGELSELYRMESNIEFRSFDEDIGALMVGSDLVITKANYTTVRELDALGLPQVSISYHLNPIDDIFAERILGERALYADQLDNHKLLDLLTTVLSTPRPNQNPNRQIDSRQTLRPIAEVIAEAIRNAKPPYFSRT